ncbi:MAG: two-component sensor histidine kinase [Phycisphaeraceae bacterium]|nr:MAG: two-component sensor histidine kinase [Phycisphaeraceae bacterium]
MEGGATNQHTGPGRPRVSLRIRLTLWVVAIFCLIQWVTGGVFWLYQRSSIERVLDEALSNRAALAAEQIRPELPLVDDFELLGVTRQLRHFSFGRFYLDVFGQDGQSVLTHPTGRVVPESLPLARAFASEEPILAEVMLTEPPQQEAGASQRKKSKAKAALVLVRDHMGDPYVMALVATDDYSRNQLQLVARVLLLASVIGPIAAAISGWFIAGIAVAPLERFRLVAAKLGPESMEEEIDLETSNTEVASLANELNDARERIKQAFAAQERFLSNVSHEIKTPISVMLAEAQTLPLDDASPEMRDFVDSVTEEMTRLGNLVESFLTLSRVRDGKDPVHRKVYAANDLVMDCIDRCLLMAEQHDVRLVPTLIGGEDGMDVKVLGDPDLLCTMLDNLVRNAIRFSPEGGRVEIAAGLDGKTVTIRVIDEGAGIPADRIETIFDRFSRSETGARSGRGHGLGLSIAQGVAELHRGSISAQNREPTGCCFEVRLRRRRPKKQA